MKKIAIIGGTGNGLVVAQIILDLIASGEAYEIVGFLNDHIEVGEFIENWPVLGPPSEWHTLAEDILFIPAILSVGKMKERADKLKSLGISGERLATVIHPTANIGFSSVLGNGVAVCAHTTIQPGVKIGDCCIIRAGANIGHDVYIESFVDIGPNSTLCGYARVHEGVQVAPNAVIRDNLVIREYSTIAAGAAVFKDVPERATFLGNPARRIR